MGGTIRFFWISLAVCLVLARAKMERWVMAVVSIAIALSRSKDWPILKVSPLAETTVWLYPLSKYTDGVTPWTDS